NNQLMVRMALAENVYNGMASEQAVYPKDFEAGSASLNELGTRRVEALIHVCRGGWGNIAVIRGDEPDVLYDARIAAVQQQFADSGIDMSRVSIAKADHVSGKG